MTRLSIVVAIAHNRVIGANNTMPWHLPEDLKRFKSLTLGKPVIMGRRTYDSIGRALPGRRNIVITRDANWMADGVEVVHSLDEALMLVKNDTEASIIGGAQLYLQAMGIAQSLMVTEIDLNVPGDTYFPKIDPEVWMEVSRQSQEDERGQHFDFVEYQRRT